MPTNPQAISKKTWLALALEATQLTGAATTNLIYIPTKGSIEGIQHVEYPDEDRNTVDDNNTKVATNREGKFELKGAFYPDATPQALWTLIGAPTTTQPDVTNAPTVYKHTLNFQDIPPTASVYKSWHQIVQFSPGGTLQKATLKWDSKKLLEFDGSGICLFPQKYTGAALVPSFSTVKPFSGWMPTITLNGTASADVDEMTINFERKSELWFPSANTQDATRIDFGGRSADIEFTARFDVDTFYTTYFTGQTDATVAIDFIGPLIATTFHQELNLSFGTVGIDEAKVDEGKDNVLVKFKGKVRPTAGALCTGYVQNTITAYVAS